MDNKDPVGERWGTLVNLARPAMMDEGKDWGRETENERTRDRERGRGPGEVDTVKVERKRVRLVEIQHITITGGPWKRTTCLQG